MVAKYIKGSHLNKWSEQCGLGYLDCYVTKHFILNTSQITNSGSFVYKCASQKIVENLLVYPKLRVLTNTEGLTPKLWKLQVRSLFMVIKQEFNTTIQTMKILQSEVNSVASVVLQNCRVLDTVSPKRRSL